MGQRRRRTRLVAACAVAALALGGCSSLDTRALDSLPDLGSVFELEPVEGWRPPAWPDAAGVVLVEATRDAGGTEGDSSDGDSSEGDSSVRDAASDDSADADSADADSSGGDASGGSSGGGSAGDSLEGGSADGDRGSASSEGDGGGSDGGGGSAGLGSGSGADMGLTGGRLRNDGVGFAARYVQLPMEHRFNDRVDELLWQAIRERGGTYAPSVHPSSAKLGARGCAKGSLTWPAERVLESGATGLPKGAGTAVTCEVLGAFGSIVGVGMRVVTGDGSRVEADRVLTLYADVVDGSLYETGRRWNDDAPGELWQRVVEQLRREAGGMSSAEIAPPDEQQLALAETALEAARYLDGGELILSIPPGVASPELERLGLEPTAEPLEARIDTETAERWATRQMDVLEHQRTLPFVGLPDWNAGLPVDCELVPCVAVTYDDGPSPFTPALLDTLWNERAPATFFLVGTAVASHPEIVARAAREGHELASHTVKHADLTKLKPREARDQVLDAAKAITAITGAPVTSFRPPYGAVNDKILEEVDLPAVLWSVDTNDWREPGTDELLKRSVDAASPGDIVLFHDIHEPSVDAAADVFAGLRDRGFVPVTVTQLFDGSIPDGRVTKR